MIEFKNVSKSYNKKILDNFSFYLEDRENMAIFGKSGIGKTTILNLILGLEKPDTGTINKNFYKASVVFQENRLINEISALDNLRLITDDGNLAKEILNKFGIYDLEKKINLLSGGMQRKVALGRAYLFAGDILIMDEPFTGIDASSKKEIANLLNNKFKGKSIIIVSHNPEDFELFSINKNKIIHL